MDPKLIDMWVLTGGIWLET